MHRRAVKEIVAESATCLVRDSIYHGDTGRMRYAIETLERDPGNFDNMPLRFLAAPGLPRSNSLGRLYPTPSSSQ
jgi:hypothetical protein